LSKQGEFQAIIDHADRQWWTRIDTFARANRQRYLDFGAFITPCDFTTEEVFKRLAFSILSVKTPFDRACGAFAKVMKLPARERVHKRSLMRATDDVMYRTVKVRALQGNWPYRTRPSLNAGSMSRGTTTGWVWSACTD